MLIIYIEGSQVIILKKTVFLFLKIDFACKFANKADPVVLLFAFSTRSVDPLEIHV